MTIESIRKQLSQVNSRSDELEKKLAERTKNYNALKQGYSDLKIQLNDVNIKLQT